MFKLDDLPTLNACLNFLSMSCLLAGYGVIKNKRVQLHKRFMLGALFFSTLFLMSYVYYHYHAGSKIFPDLGLIKVFYLIILIPHVILAVVMLPFIFYTFYLAYRGEWTKHRKVARITLPIWLYVSFSGVVVYLMLYRFYA